MSIYGASESSNSADDTDLAAQQAQAAADAAARGDEVDQTDEKLPEKAPEPDTELKLDDDAETDDEKAAREAEEAEEAKKKRVRIPLDRHEKVLETARNEAKAREEQLLARVQELERRQPQEQRRDVLGDMKAAIDTLQDKYEDLLFEGEKDQARQARKELDNLRERYTDAKVAASGNLARAQTIDSLKYDASLARVEADYPELNPDNDATFDPAKAQEVAEMLSMLQNNGMTREAALGKAVKYVMGDKKTGAGDTAAETMAQRRAQEARQKAADASKRQPANSNLAGQDNDKAGNRDGGKKFDVMRATQEQFAKISEEDKAAMRGDTI